jgi:hypothetical protein
LLRLDDVEDETDRLGVVRVDELRGQHEVQGVLLPDDARQHPRAGTGVRHQPTTDEDPREPGTGRGDPDVAERGQLDTQSCRGAVDGGDHRLAAVGEVPLLAVAEVLPVTARLDAAQLAEVGARAELTRYGGEDHDPDVGVGVGLCRSRDQVVVHPVGQRVALLGTVDRDGGDAVIDLVVNVAIHRPPPPDR